jgi:hypothetical protein
MENQLVIIFGKTFHKIKTASNGVQDELTDVRSLEHLYHDREKLSPLKPKT